jgi:hypothetical protein
VVRTKSDGNRENTEEAARVREALWEEQTSRDNSKVSTRSYRPPPGGGPQMYLLTIVEQPQVIMTRLGVVPKIERQDTTRCIERASTKPGIRTAIRTASKKTEKIEMNRARGRRLQTCGRRKAPRQGQLWFNLRQSTIIRKTGAGTPTLQRTSMYRGRSTNAKKAVGRRITLEQALRYNDYRCGHWPGKHALASRMNGNPDGRW